MTLTLHFSETDSDVLEDTCFLLSEINNKLSNIDKGNKSAVIKITYDDRNTPICDIEQSEITQALETLKKFSNNIDHLFNIYYIEKEKD